MEKRMNSVIKYICVEELEQDIDKFDHAETLELEVPHSSFDELHEAVFSNCPTGYHCTEPIALFHEVLWSMGLKHTGGRCVRDELHHALERWEYDMLHAKDNTLLSLCVDIVRTSSDPPSEARPVVL
jgi:hypothetical protein